MELWTALLDILILLAGAMVLGAVFERLRQSTLLGYLLAGITSVAYDTELFRFPVVSTPATWIWTLVLAVLFGLSAHLLVQIAVHRMDWLGALQAQE